MLRSRLVAGILGGAGAVAVMVVLNLLAGAGGDEGWCLGRGGGPDELCGRAMVVWVGGVVIVLGVVIWWSVKEMRRQSRIRSRATSKEPPPEA